MVEMVVVWNYHATHLQFPISASLEAEIFFVGLVSSLRRVSGPSHG